MNSKAPDLVVAKFDYRAADSHELGICKGERLTLLDDTQHWWKVMNAQGRIGYVPSNYVKRSKQGIFSSLRNTLGRRKSRRDGPTVSGSGGSASARPSKPSSPTPDSEATDILSGSHLQRGNSINNGIVTLPPGSGRHYSGSADSLGAPALPPLDKSITLGPSQAQQQWSRKTASSGDIGAPFAASLPSAATGFSGQVVAPAMPNQGTLDYAAAYDENSTWDSRFAAMSSAKQNHAWVTNNSEQMNALNQPKPMHIKQNGHHFPEETPHLAFPPGNSTGGHMYSQSAGGNMLATPQFPHLHNRQPKQQQQICNALFTYSASQPDELSITRGDKIAVVEKSSDGWWRGVLLTEDSHRPAPSGWFPSNYVTTADLTSLSADSIAHRSNIVTRNPPTVLSTPTTADQQSRSVVSSAPQSAASTMSTTAAAVGSAGGASSICQQERVLTLFPFVQNQEEEMSFDANEVLDVIEKPQDDPEWWRCRNALGRTGLVPRNYVRVLPPSPSPVTMNHRVAVNGRQQPDRPSPDQQQQQQRQHIQKSENLAHLQQEHHQRIRIQFATQSKAGRTNADRVWYWGAISRAECENMLAQYSMPGEFVIRDSESHPGDLTVTINAGCRARNFKVHVERGEYHIGQKVFPSLDELIEHYRNHPIFKSEQEKHYLTRPFIYPGGHSGDDLTRMGPASVSGKPTAGFPSVSTAYAHGNQVLSQ